MKKYWISKDGQNEIGAWDIDTPDEEIMAELLAGCGEQSQRENILSGEIRTGDWVD